MLNFWKHYYVGRRAKLVTCNRNETYRDTHGEFRFDGDYLVCDSYRSAFAPFCAKECKLMLRVTDDMLVNITSNAQVLPDTVFV